MNNRQDSRNSMFQRVRDFLNANASITSKLPNFAALLTALINAIILIDKYAKQQMQDRSGFEKNKKRLRDKLIQVTADISRKMQAYASSINNLVLAAETKLLVSDLNTYSDNNLKNSAMGLYDIVEEKLTDLGTFELTEATQEQFLADITAFNDAIPEPHLGRTDKKQDTGDLKKAFEKGDEALDKINKVVEIVRLSQPTFYLGYKSASKIIITGSNPLAVKGLVIDADTGQPIKGTKVSFAIINNGTVTNGTPTLIKITAEKGGLNIKSLPPAMYNVTVSKNGYTEQSIKIAVSQGETTRFKVELKKV